MGSVIKLVKLTEDSEKWFIYLSPGMRCRYAAFGSIVLRGPPVAAFHRSQRKACAKLSGQTVTLMDLQWHFVLLFSYEELSLKYIS